MLKSSCNSFENVKAFSSSKIYVSPVNQSRDYLICWSKSGQNTMVSKPLCGDQASCLCIRHQSRPSLLVCYLNFVRRGLSGGLRQAGVTADRKPTFNLLTPAFCRILQAAGAKTVFGRQLILTREIYIETEFEYLRFLFD